jgi:predicted NBD/HSP70 family sugar kinase
VLFENDVNLAAVGEHVEGVARVWTISFYCPSGAAFEWAWY